MVKKYQVLVREVYEQEGTEMVWSHKETGEIIQDYQYKHIGDDDPYTKQDFVRKGVKTGKMELLITDNDPIYGQLFHEDELDMRDLILHLNRTR